MSKFLFMGYGCNLFDVIVARFVAVFISIKRKSDFSLWAIHNVPK